MTRDELILYATPQGPLARACEQYFAAANGLGATTAQTYPPHCTLTGFFYRTPERTRVIVEEVQEQIDEAGPLRPADVELLRSACHETWFGLELRSARLLEITAAIVDEHPLGPGDDPLRPKDWLHLSLAYDVADVAPYVALAADDFELLKPDRWQVGLWQRHRDGSWAQLTV